MISSKPLVFKFCARVKSGDALWTRCEGGECELPQGPGRNAGYAKQQREQMDTVDRAPSLSLQVFSTRVTQSRIRVSAAELGRGYGTAFLTRDCKIPFRAVQPHQQQMFGEELPEAQDGEQPGPARRKRQPSMSETMPLYTLCKEDLESMDKEVRMWCRSQAGGWCDQHIPDSVGLMQSRYRCCEPHLFSSTKGSLTI